MAGRVGLGPRLRPFLGAACCCVAGSAPHVEGGGRPAGGRYPARLHRDGYRSLPWAYELCPVAEVAEGYWYTGPRKNRDGRFTTSEGEVALWRSVMEFLHDMQEGEEEEEEEEDEEVDLAAERGTALVRAPLPGLYARCRCGPCVARLSRVLRPTGAATPERCSSPSELRRPTPGRSHAG